MFSLRAEEGAVILVNGHGSGHKDVRIALDGSTTEVPGENAGAVARYRGQWKDGTFTYEVEFVRAPGQAPEGLIRRDFRMTEDGLIVRYNYGAPEDSWWVGLYRHAGIRACEIGSVMFGGAGHTAPALELVRLAIPRRVYTQSHIDYVIEAIGELFAKRHTLRGLQMTHEPAALRHFTAQFAEC